MGHHEMTKPKNNRDRRRKRTPTQKHRKCIQQNHRRKPSQPKEGYPYEDTKTGHQTDWIKKKISSSHQNQNSKHTE